MTNFSAERDTSIKGWFMRFLGYTLVPPHHVLVLLKDGELAKFVPTGYHYLTNLRYTQGPFISVGMRSPVYVDKITCRSLEGVPFTIKARVLFSFDPRICTLEEVKTQLAEVPDVVIGQILERETDNAVRVVAGRFRELELSRGVTLDELQKQVTAHLENALHPLGYRLIGDVQLPEISPDPAFEKLNLEGLSMRRYALGLEDLSDEQRSEIIELAQMLHFSRGNGQVRHSRYAKDRPSDSGNKPSTNRRRPDTFS